MRYVPHFASPSLSPKVLGVQGRMTLRLIKRPGATIDAASGRIPASPTASRRPHYSTRLNR
ncbi:MAG: hypothetical protein ACLFTE_01150 [Salinivenus sp.]